MAQSSNSSATRASLISRARTRDSQAWNELVELYGPLVLFWCRRGGLEHHSAADCVQEVFLSVSKAIGRFRPSRESGSFRAWLRVITTNKLRDFHQQLQKSNSIGAGGSSARRTLESLADERDETGSMGLDFGANGVGLSEADAKESSELAALVRRGLASIEAEFEPRTWSIFRRHVIDQIPTEIVASEFQVSAAAVRQTRSRVLRRLRAQLGDVE